MKKFLKSPLAKYPNERIWTTLPYGDKTYAVQYKLLGWNIVYHNGEDYVNSTDPLKAYGSPILATQDGVVQKVIWEGSVSKKGNGITIEGLPFYVGDKKILLCEVHWHASDVWVKAGDFVKAGQRIGSLGNSGFTIGTKTSPMKGTHTHFMVYPYIWNNKWELMYPNNVVQGADNPLNWLENFWNLKAPIYEPDKKEHIGGILEIISKTIDKLKEFFKGRK